MARACRRGDGMQVKSMGQRYCQNCKKRFGSQRMWFNHLITVF